MRTSDAVGLGILAYLLYRYTSTPQKIPPEKTSTPDALEPDQKFQTLSHETQSTLLRNYSQDYVAAKAIPDADYQKVLDASNQTGTPIAWAQEIYKARPTATFEELVEACENTLETCNKYITAGCDSLDTVRELSILSGMQNLSGAWFHV